MSVEQLSLFDGEDDEMTRHVIGTQLEDLAQIYTGKVTIRGSLRVNRVTLDRPNRMTNVNVNGNDFVVDAIQSNYWMKSMDQVRSGII